MEDFHTLSTSGEDQFPVIPCNMKDLLTQRSVTASATGRPGYLAAVRTQERIASSDILKRF